MGGCIGGGGCPGGSAMAGGLSVCAKAAGTAKSIAMMKVQRAMRCAISAYSLRPRRILGLLASNNWHCQSYFLFFGRADSTRITQEIMQKEDRRISLPAWGVRRHTITAA
jgi:hypothetical protein